MRNEPVLVLLIPPRERPAQIFFRRKSFFVRRSNKTNRVPHRTRRRQTKAIRLPLRYLKHTRALQPQSFTRKDVGKFSAGGREKIAEGKTGERKDKPCSYT